MSRETFLARLRDRLATGIPENHVRPWHPLEGDAPEVQYADPPSPDGLVDRFLARIQRVSGVGRRMPNDRDAFDRLISELRQTAPIQRAVVAADPICDPIRDVLAAVGVELLDATRAA